MSWTKDRIAKAAKLWASGMSAREVAEELGVTRNAVIGIANRNSDLFARRRPGVAAGTVRQRTKQEREKRERAKRRTFLPERANETAGNAIGAVKARSRLPDAVGVEPLPADPFPVPRASSSRLADEATGEVPAPVAAIAFRLIGRGECRWPVAGAPGPEMLCCGAPVADPAAIPGNRAASHCPAHLALSGGVGTVSERNATRVLAHASKRAS